MIEFRTTERHDKGWGHEEWIANTDRYCGKLLVFNAGGRCSDHFHLAKTETWYVVSGTLGLDYYDTTTGRGIYQLLRAGDVVHIPAGQPHRLKAITDATIFEVSTPHDEADSYRIRKGDSQSG